MRTKRSVLPAASAAPAKTTKPPAAAPHQVAAKFTYRLEPYLAERRATGWFIARAVPGFTGQKPEWSGPYELIENAAYAIARRHMVEIADRHTKQIERHALDHSHPLYGLKRTTRPKA